MAVASRAADLARIAAGLAGSASVELPDGLALWELAGGRPAKARPQRAEDPARALGAALEKRLTASERQRGAHYSPAVLAARLAELALPRVEVGRPPFVCDPACGAGSLLLAAAERIAGAGVPRRRIVEDLVFGADVDPLSVAVTEAALALWSGGVAPAAGHLVVADPLVDGTHAWRAAPDGFDAVVGNPPFQGQLARATARSRLDAEVLRSRFGPEVVTPYVDTAALFLLAAADMTARGGRVALVQPASVAAARDAAPVRRALAARAAVVELWAPAARLFAASVHVCVPVLEVGRRGRSDWARMVARARGVPAVRLAGGTTVGQVARVVAGFRDEYYGLAAHVREADPVGPDDGWPLVTSGVIDLGRCRWGERPVRFAKRLWDRPVVDRAAVDADGGRAAALLRRTGGPKVVVASQTKVVEVAVDEAGTWAPCTPVISVVPGAGEGSGRPGGPVPGTWELATALAAPPTVAWLLDHTEGTGLQPGALRVTAPLLALVPLPVDGEAWREAARALSGGDLAGFAVAASAAHGLQGSAAAAVVDWWWARLPADRRGGGAVTGRGGAPSASLAG
ncbi:MAG: N-6 DNA methylase [Acidimicrobiia bacterium]